MRGTFGRWKYGEAQALPRSKTKGLLNDAINAQSLKEAQAEMAPAPPRTDRTEIRGPDMSKNDERVQAPPNDERVQAPPTVPSRPRNDVLGASDRSKSLGFFHDAKARRKTFG